MSLFNQLTRNLLPAALLALCSAAHAESRSIAINDPRPVAKAVETLEAVYGWPIAYEDPPYVHESEMVDVTALVRRDQQDVNALGVRKVMIPRGGAFSFTFDNNVRPASEMKAPALATRDAIREMLGSYSAASGDADMFSLIETNGLFQVVPNRFTNISGRREKITPLLDVTVSVLPKQRTGAELVGEICRSLSLATGQTVIIGTTPGSLLARHQTTIAATHEAARSVLSRLLAELPDRLSWQLFNDPGLHWYVLNIHTIAPANN